MSWIELVDINGIDQIREASKTKPQLIFKHSTRCGISASAKWRMDGEMEMLSREFDIHYLDLISYRNVSNHIADTFNVMHQSPQVLIIHQGKSVYNASHSAIDPSTMMRKWGAIAAL